MITVIIIAGAFEFVKSFLKNIFEFFKVFCKEAFCRNQVPPARRTILRLYGANPNAGCRRRQQRSAASEAAQSTKGTALPHKRRAGRTGNPKCFAKGAACLAAALEHGAGTCRQRQHKKTPEPENAQAGERRGPPGPGNPSAQNHPRLHGANPSTGCRSTSDKIESVRLPPRKSSLQTAESAEGGSFLTEHRIWKRVFKIHAGHRIPAPQAADFNALLARNFFQRSRPHKTGKVKF